MNITMKTAAALISFILAIPVASASEASAKVGSGSDKAAKSGIIIVQGKDGTAAKAAKSTPGSDKAAKSGIIIVHGKEKTKTGR